MRTFKIIVTGPFNAGKTTFIRTLCGRILETDRMLSIKTVKPTTTVALDFGLLEIGEGKRVRLFGTPGQRRFFFMWRILAAGMDGYILMVDSQDVGSLLDAAYVYEYFRKNFPDKPHVISANKADKENRIPMETIRNYLKVPPEIQVKPTIAVDRASSLRVVNCLVDLIEREFKKG